jgi:hypothetical protein
MNNLVELAPTSRATKLPRPTGKAPSASARNARRGTRRLR